MFCRRLLIPFIAAAFAANAVLAADVAELLRRAEEAGKHVSYRGMKTAAVRLAGEPTTAVLKVVHLKPDKTRTEYFAPALLAGVILIENGSELWRFDPHEKAWEPVCSRLTARRQHRGGQHDEGVSERMLENYEVRLTGTDRVAGRQAYVIHAIPKYRSESGRRLWIDREFYLVVGTQVEGSNGSVISSSRFTTLEFNPDDISRALFKPSGNVKSAPRANSADFDPLKPSYIPKGYGLVGISRLTLNRCSSIHMKYSNGMSTISLFQHRANGPSGAGCRANGSAGILSWTRAGIRFTLMGDLPRSELQKIADSVK